MSVSFSGSLAHVQGTSAAYAHYWFYRDPIRGLELVHSRYGKAVRIDDAVPWSTAAPVFLLVGADANEAVLNDVGNIRPTGVWPVRGPQESAQENMRSNNLTAHGVDRIPIAKAIASQTNQRLVSDRFAQVRDITLKEVGIWPLDQPIDLYARIRHLSQQHAFQALYGESDPSRLEKFGEMIERYHRSNWSLPAMFMRFDLPGMPYRRVLKNAEELEAFVSDWALEQSGCPATANMRAAMVNAREQTGETVSLRKCVANLSATALASYETSSTTLTWALFLLAHHPEAATSLWEELASAPPIEEWDEAQLEQLPFLSAVIKETMRLVAPVPFLGFRTLADTEYLTHEVPERSLILLSPHLTHRDPSVFDNPSKFDPARWSESDPAEYEYVPFSGGPRQCPGRMFALNNLRVSLAAIVSRFGVSFAPDHRVDRTYSGVTRPKDEVVVTLRPQDGRFEMAHVHGSAADLIDCPWSNSAQRAV